MAQQPSFDLLPATRADIPRMTAIHMSACAIDVAIPLYLPDPADLERRIMSMLEQQVGVEAFTHTKAVDRATGEMGAWSTFVRTNYDLDPPASEGQSLGAPKTSLKKGNEFQFGPGLASTVRAETEKVLKAHIGDKPHFQCKGLHTDPAFQRRGMGTALVQAGNRMADEAGLPILLQASPFGYPVYAANGFEVLGSYDADLREWAPNAKGGDRGYGNYRWRFMARAVPVVR